ncbi:MAG: hypothetical protein JWN48_4137 [Myxococcaceae bacterium]|nr:hypothetical protein [Myxococcaceae bacterium]
MTEPTAPLADAACPPEGVNPSAGAEARRLSDAKHGVPWREWGPYLSERQWGTVREDYSRDGSAWDYFPHDHARSRAYRWGEDGLAGYSDTEQRLCFALALWNGRDAILKERLFGLTNDQGNHGEDVKELYYYTDATPTHSYLSMLYRYPQCAYPYELLLEQNRARGLDQPELELYDTGAFDEGRFFEVRVEYAKSSPLDTSIRITATNMGPTSAELHLLPQLWFRNTWSWCEGEPRPHISLGHGALLAQHHSLGSYLLQFEPGGEALFTDNDTNLERLFGDTRGGHFKDAFHEAIVHGRREALRVDRGGTKAAIHYARLLEPGQSTVLTLRLVNELECMPLADASAVFQLRQREADAFYENISAGKLSHEAAAAHRQALAGMIWSKQFYYFDVRDWLHGDPGQPAPPAERQAGRDAEWRHLTTTDVLSMPDKWEYPWFAAWDLAFHCLPLATIDPEFAKAQLVLLTREWYMHPNGQLPAYEWAFGDVNPPVHAWATWRVFEIDRALSGHGDHAFLERVFHKLMLNFTWWVNRKDKSGRNIFEGGFLGLDNIGVFNRSEPLPTGGELDQADGTSWMAMYALNLMRIALELAQHNSVYEDIATKFFQHFLSIAEAMNDMAGRGIGLWDEQDEFFYDVLRAPGLGIKPLRVRSMVGLIPLFAVEVLEPGLLDKVPAFAERLRWFLAYRPDLTRLVSRWTEPGRGDTRLLALLRGSRMKRVLRRMLDETEFLSPYGVRALSKIHEQAPYVFSHGDLTTRVDYTPGESTTRAFGGNSNWRGPVWFPVNHLIIESLRKFHTYYGNDFLIECPTGSGQMLTLDQIADELSRRLSRLFLSEADGVRPIYRGTRLAEDARLREPLLFYEYFHGDTGRGVGACHQTGWTGLLALQLDPRKL